MSHALLATVRSTEAAEEFLRCTSDFDLDGTEHVEEVVLASGESLEPIAGDGAGGTYFLCGEGGDERPVLYADSEGGAALVAIGLPELIRLLLAVPWWRDCRKFTVEESAEAAEWYLEDEPGLLAERDAAAAALGLELPSEAAALARLREVATGPGPGRDLVLLNAEEGTAYRALFG
ncbi:hypothetical protein ACFVHB_23310 [Kitasatospora sp. NPDC127111]|uniref:hypothetical protein n=1 Tax=Kitasatospora sp. NPDC127111 TaxID=3345363 RepID=UPI00363D9C89